MCKYSPLHPALKQIIIMSSIIVRDHTSRPNKTNNKIFQISLIFTFLDHSRDGVQWLDHTVWTKDCVSLPAEIKHISPKYPDQRCGPTSLLFNRYRGLFHGGTAAMTWSWPLTSNYVQPYSTLPYAIMAWLLNKHENSFTFSDCSRRQNILDPMAERIARIYCVLNFFVNANFI
jgi:hypothetical protein